MAQAAKTKTPTPAKRGARAKTLTARDRRETPEERDKRLARNAYVREWRKRDLQKKRGIVTEPFRPDPLPAATTIAAAPVSALSALSGAMHISAAAGTQTTLSDVRAALRVLIQTHDRQVRTADPSGTAQSVDAAQLKGVVSGLRMALSMLD